MGVDLLSESAAFRRGVMACAAALKPHGLDLMAAFSQEDGFSDPIMAAVSLTAVQVSTCWIKTFSFIFLYKDMTWHPEQCRCTCQNLL